MQNQYNRVMKSWWAICLIFVYAALAAGCRTTSPPTSLKEAVASTSTNTVLINPGDVIQITFPGAATMNTTERVRVDGRLLLPLIGEVTASGKTPLQLQNELAGLYAPHLQIKEVLVLVSSSSASIFVSGAVNRPGRISLERPLSLLDAIMEAGGFDPKRANVKKISVIRQRDGKYSKHMLDLKPVLRGENVEPFMLEPFDVVYVPEKIF